MWLSERLLVFHQEPNGRKVQDAKVNNKSPIDLNIRGRLYRIDLDTMEQTLINKEPQFPDSVDEKVRFLQDFARTLMDFELKMMDGLREGGAEA